MIPFVGFLLDLVANIFLIVLALQWLLPQRMLYSSAFFLRLMVMTDKVVEPLNRLSPSRNVALLLAGLLVVLLIGLLLGLLLRLPQLLLTPSSLVGYRMVAHYFGSPVLTSLLLSFQFIFDTILQLLLVSVVLTALIERYTVNPIVVVVYRIVDQAVGVLEPLLRNLKSPWQTRLGVSLAAVFLSTCLSFSMLLGLSLLAPSPEGLVQRTTPSSVSVPAPSRESVPAVPLEAENSSGASASPSVPAKSEPTQRPLKSPGFVGLLLLCFYSSLALILRCVGFFALVLIVGAVISWFSPDPRNPLVRFIHMVSHPILAPFQKFIPLVAGIDISPIFAIIALYAGQALGFYLLRFLLQLTLNLVA